VNYNIENERYYASIQDRHGVTSNIEIQNVYRYADGMGQLFHSSNI
jgi:hypothetical protein